MAQTYGIHERAALFVLMLADREIPNPELVKEYGIVLRPAGASKPAGDELITTRKDGNRLVHRITEKGLRWGAGELLGGEAPPRSGPLVRALLDVARRLVTDPRFADLLQAEPRQPADVESLIRTAYWELATRPQDWVRLARLRPKLDGADRAEVDAVLFAMTRTGLVHLAPSANRKALTEDDHAAAVRVGGQDKHLLAIEES